MNKINKTWKYSLEIIETLTLFTTFEQWVLELWYFTWVFLVIRPFRVYHYFFTLWPWPWILIYFLKTLTLLITFEQWELELSYCNWAFLVTWYSYEYQDICPCDLGHLWNWPLSGAFVFHKHILFILISSFGTISFELSVHFFLYSIS